MFEIGRLCMKIAGRDAGKICIVIDQLDDNYVMIDGQTRRRKCNINHLELIDKIVEIKKNASNKEVVNVLKELNIEAEEKKSSEKSSSAKPVRKRVAAVAAKPAKAEEKKAVKKDKKEKAEKVPKKAKK